MWPHKSSLMEEDKLSETRIEGIKSMKINVTSCTYDRIYTRFIQHSKGDYVSNLDLL